MKVLVTGGSGVVGAGAIPELLRAGHAVRLLSRGAREDARDYPERVEARAGDITDGENLKGAADGCHAIVHIAGIIEEKPPDLTFERVNIGGTRNLLEEAERGGVRRFIYISSLGADTGASEYQRSKLASEELVRASDLEWLILRAGNVYGPGDEVLSVLLKMVRTLPVIPVIAGGDQPFQPVWFADLGKAIATACEMESVRQIYEIAGPDVTTTRDVIERICAITGRHPTQVPLPTWLAQVGTNMAEMFGGVGQKLASRAGLAMPINSAKLQMLMEGNVAHSDRDVLGEVFGIEPTPLSVGLVELADQLPELLPEEGMGALRQKRFWADIQDSRLSPEGIIDLLCQRITEIMPIEFAAEPAAATESCLGSTMTGAIPGRGNVQVRVEERTPRSVTLVTVEGHPLAGVVTLRAEPSAAAVRFLVEVHVRAANLLDWIALGLVGNGMQAHNWREVVRRTVQLSGGHAPEGIQSSCEELDAENAARVERRARDIVQRRRRTESREELESTVRKVA